MIKKIDKKIIDVYKKPQKLLKIVSKQKKELEEILNKEYIETLLIYLILKNRNFNIKKLTEEEKKIVKKQIKDIGKIGIIFFPLLTPIPGGVFISLIFAKKLTKK